ncbi:hypothetical protein MRB53_019624 [Persea americana]|uniref:Uncharacterized protein n=1 Tax=Persea americana TaxID=3435 RepID=A0ACC2KYY5_PERAE|nr:hypothetical protein MRB53_019624 [Persea americana]|eukprot:TRINITY_DN17611_c0_g1_i1.p4 TRINITY_DN17611_c0_g1~~TRINITY_DN17611_c0_g1_i1.p4  ORF type:complete len:108 (-),score=12.18 TRINITY_DN17611_c0_g1_i1:165-488(-)
MADLLRPSSTSRMYLRREHPYLLTFEQHSLKINPGLRTTQGPSFTNRQSNNNLLQPGTLRKSPLTLTTVASSQNFYINPSTCAAQTIQPGQASTGSNTEQASSATHT